MEFLFQLYGTLLPILVIEDVGDKHLFHIIDWLRPFFSYFHWDVCVCVLYAIGNIPYALAC